MTVSICQAAPATDSSPKSADIKSEDIKPDLLEITKIYYADMNGTIGVSLEEHVEKVFDTVDREKSILVFRMDTPGGLVTSMSRIISLIGDAEFPVVVWVAPSGSRAASAGAFIVQAAHVAVMSPESNIGAAHPVSVGGEDVDDSNMDKKIVNDLTAKIRSFAQERGRNSEIAEKMVTESISLTSREALENNVIDFIARDENELIEQLKDRTINLKGREVTLKIDAPQSEIIDMDLRLRLLGFISSPDIAYLALLAGIFLIVLEFKAPGGFVMGATGGVLLLMAAYGLKVLPVNLSGIALLIAGLLFIVLDLVFGGMGIIALVGIGSMVFGGLLLFKAPGGELLNLSIGFITGVTLVIAVIFLILLRMVYKALRQQPLSGTNVLIGERVTISGCTDKNLMVFVHGEYWRAVSIDPTEELLVGDEVEIVKVESLMLKVKRLPQ